MSTSMTFVKVKDYLNAIADKNLSEGNGDIGNSPHGRFWEKQNGVPVTYLQFINGIVPGGAQVECNGRPTPIIDKNNPAKTPFYLILADEGRRLWRHAVHE